MFGCWGFQRPSLKQGAAGTAHFKPGGVFFRDGQRPNRRRWFASRGAAHALNAYQATSKLGIRSSQFSVTVLSKRDQTTQPQLVLRLG
jgi:hypothetical protein